MIVAIVGVLVFATLLAIAAAALRSVRTQSTRDLQAVLAQIEQGDFAPEADKDTAVGGWFGYWATLARRAGSAGLTGRTAGLVALLSPVGGFTVGLLLGQSPIWAVIGACGALGGVQLWWGQKASKRGKALEESLPLLISGLRANVQAGMPPVPALLATVEDIPGPLGEEMRAVATELQVSVPLEQALAGLAKRTNSREAGFLAASIQIAARTGADLEPQLEVLAELLSQRQRIRGKVDRAIASSRASLIVASAAVPIGLLNSIRDASNRHFWFSSAGGLMTLMIVGLLYFGGLGLTRMMAADLLKA